MTLEVAVLDIKSGASAAFEQSFSAAQEIIASMPGYISHRLQRCVENPDRYILMVEWESLEAHTIGFRQSEKYQRWRHLLHNFYDPFPTVEHYEPVFSNGR